MRHWTWTVVAAVCFWCVSAGLAGEFVWLEGEAGTANAKVNNAGWGNAHFLSDGKWMHIAIDAGKVDAEVSGEAIAISYPFQIAKAGKYEVWDRIGFEFARSGFEYRIDTGEWKKISPDDLTTDLMEIAFFCEVAWIKLGDAELSAGAHTLEIRIPKVKGRDGKTQRILYACDALCIAEGAFAPNGRFKPGETGQEEKDVAAGKMLFKLPESAAGQRSAVSLKGAWEICRDDEQMPGEVAEPIKALPKVSFWRGIEVPSDKNKARPDLLFAHRVWYRTRVEVPASMAGRSFYLDFPYNNLNTTVFVNGVYCGFEKNPFCHFQIDVSKAIKPGAVNEVWVGIRDAWYGRTADPERPIKLRRTFNTPLKFFGDGFQDLDYPIWNSPQSGILCAPSFVAAGSVYASDVFVKPLVDQKKLEAEITLHNSCGAEVAGEIRWEAIDDASGTVARTFAPKAFTAAPGLSMVMANDGFAEGKLWWPDQPHMYRLRTTVMVGGKAVDTRETSFGYRQWKIEGTKFTLNGVVWHLWADLQGDRPATAQEWVAGYRKANERLMRFGTAGQGGVNVNWFGMEPAQALDFMDRNGIVVRRNTTLDGEAIGSNFSEKDEVLRKKNGTAMKVKLMQNWLDQCVAQVKGERNHPSIQIWSIENEFAFINLINLLGSSPLMDEYEAAIKKTHDAVMAADPTRSAMCDGGGAMKANTLGVAGDHYVATLDVRYPDLAYEAFAEGGGRGRWQWDMKRPRYIGEEFYATGINPADYAMWGGEIAFQGKAATREAVATCYRMLQEGYRWSGLYAAWHLWLGGEGGARSRIANAPRAALVRQWDWTFGSGQKVVRSFGVFNDTQYADPITLTRVLTIDGKEVHKKTTEHNVKPGTAEKFDEELLMPAVSSRQEGQLLLTLLVGGKEIFRDSKAVSVLPAVKADSLLSTRSAIDLAVYDPRGVLKPFVGSGLIEVKSLASLPGAKVLLVAPDALTEADSTATELASYASAGRTVIVLDQTNVLKYQAIPAEIELADRTRLNDFRQPVPAADGSTAFIEDASHPVLKGLQDKDFFTWAGDHRVYRHAYVKPTRGGKSLLQVGPRLANSALVEIPVGKGVMYLAQLELGRKLKESAAAQTVLANLIEHGRNYKQELAQVAASIADDQLGKAMDAIGLQYVKAADPLAAIADPEKKIAIISATAANLKTLAGAMDKLQAFWARGGNVVFVGLTPEGLADYNKIVGVEHLIRKFKRERVTFPPVRNPLTSGLTTGDIVMLSGKRIFGWTADEYVASDVFTHVVDIDEIAPFATSTFHGWDNMTNGFVGSDGWPLIMDFPANEDLSPFEFKITLPREEVITEYIHDQSINYNPTAHVTLLFDGKDPVKFALTPDGDTVNCPINPPRKAREITVQLGGYQFVPGKAHNIGMDNIWIKVQRSPAFAQTVRPMLNSGGMVQYVKGSGGVVLCNLNFQESEAVPVNKIKKRTILATVLRNLKAPFAGKTVIANASLLNYQPLDIHTKATTYKDERGFFGDRARNFKGLPEGKQRFAGVDYSIYEMPTSPVPQVLMLGGQGIPNNLPKEIKEIPVGAKADALFFLHTAKMGKRMNDQEKRQRQRFVMFKYVINYAGGQKEEVPVYSEIDIEHFAQKEPRVISGAQLAWTAPFEKNPESAVAYAKQWNNPRPGLVIASIDMVYVDESRGTPVLLAITAAKVK